MSAKAGVISAKYCHTYIHDAISHEDVHRNNLDGWFNHTHTISINQSLLRSNTHAPYIETGLVGYSHGIRLYHVSNPHAWLFL